MENTNTPPSNIQESYEKLFVGKMVHFNSYGQPDRNCLAAVIVRVADEENKVVDLTVFKPQGVLHNDLVHYGDRDGQWHFIEEEHKVELID